MREPDHGAGQESQPPSRFGEHLEEENKRAEADEIEQQLRLRFSSAIEEDAETRGGQQTHRLERQEKTPENQEQQKQQNDREIDREDLGANQKFRFAHARSINEGQEKRINRHPVAILDDRVVALIEVPRI